MNINIFLLCYNESPLLPHTIKHYRNNLPLCNITIYDNESTDNSVEIAKSLNCNVISWSSNNINDEDIKINIRNNCWKDIKSGWIIMADMDEFICVTEKDLLDEMNNNTTILKINGIDMIGESETLDLTDIDLQKINKYHNYEMESKNLCFLRDYITDMNYGPGSHYCKPIGKIKYSDIIYTNKHMSNLGLNFLTNKMIKRYERSEKNRKRFWSIHYTNDVDQIKNNYNNLLKTCKILD
jgi:hypothetical protein